MLGLLERPQPLSRARAVPLGTRPVDPWMEEEEAEVEAEERANETLSMLPGPPSEEQEVLLKQIILAGFIDRVVRRAFIISTDCLI
jgi:hypothetical protein